MNRPRTLPIRVAPLPGESLDSWFVVLANRLHTPLGDLLPALGLLRRPRGRGSHVHDIPVDWTILLRPAEIASISIATGTEPHVIEAMTLSRYHGNAILIDSAARQVNRKRLWGRNAGSRFCPDCLAASGGRWQLSWRLGWSFACTVHRRLLADVCPRCQRAPHRHPLSSPSQPGRCVEPADTHGRGVATLRCGAELSTAHTLTFPAGHPVLEAQQLVLDVIEEGKARFGVYSHEPVPTVVALADLRALAGRILGYADREDFNHLPADLLAAYDHARSQPTGYRRPTSTPIRVGFMAPAQAAIAAVGVTAAVLVLASSTVRDAGTALRWLIMASRRRNMAVAPTAMGSWGRGTSTTLKTVQVSAVGPLLKPVDQLRYRTSGDSPHHRLPDPRARSRHQCVPAMFWTDWALRLRPDQDLSVRALRRALSAGLLLVGTRRSRSDTTKILNGVPDAQETTRILGRLRSHDRWPDILTALTRLADHVDAGGVPIDYHRRRRLDYNDLLSGDQWHNICLRAGFLRGRQRRVRLARCLLFEKISGLPANRAPVSFAITTPYLRDRLLDFAAGLTPEVAALLDEAAHDFLGHQGVHKEPVHWQPPLHLLHNLVLPGDNPDSIDIDTLHRLVQHNDGPLSDVAHRLGTTLDVVRHLLGQHPVPLRPQSETQARATGRQRFNARKAVSKEVLISLYVDQQLTLRAIGERVGFSRHTITNLIDEYGITRREQYRPSGIVIHRDWLYDQYVNHRRTLPDLAQESGMSTANMNRWAKTHGIPLRSRGGANHNDIRVTLAQAATAPPILRPALTEPHAWNRLHRFAAAAEHLTIRAAAAALGLGLPTLVTHIRRLEHDLGGPLLIRAQRGRPMQLTYLGRNVVAAINVSQPEVWLSVEPHR